MVVVYLKNVSIQKVLDYWELDYRNPCNILGFLLTNPCNTMIPIIKDWFFFNYWDLLLDPFIPIIKELLYTYLG